ncbi:MAG: TFIIB-type zinc ribbon-containing protein, partial [Natronomonas sp.]
MSNTNTRTDAERGTEAVESSTERRTADLRERTEACPECDGRLETAADTGETVCSECGLVVEEDEID